MFKIVIELNNTFRYDASNEIDSKFPSWQNRRI